MFIIQVKATVRERHPRYFRYIKKGRLMSSRSTQIAKTFSTIEDASAFADKMRHLWWQLDFVIVPKPPKN